MTNKIEVKADKPKGVEFLINSKKPYPDWLKSHTVFKEMNRIDKVFPKIGLPNFKEPAELLNNQEAMADAIRLGTKIRTEILNAQRNLYIELDKMLLSKEKDRNERCGNIQSLINLCTTVAYSLGYADYATVVEGKVVMKLRSDIFNGDKNPVFRQGEALLRVANKFKELVLVACAGSKLTFADVEQLEEFKSFSKNNVPKKKYNIVFSSTGEEGAWDISTISMRGIASCQTWTAPQSRGLIGSVASKFVGVIYLASDTEVPGYGSKMIRRCVVRFAINGKTKKPAILLDNMYPAQDVDTLANFKKLLKDKSGLEVLYTMDRPPTIQDYYIPDEPARKFLKQGETPYMDYALQVKDHLVSPLAPVGSIAELTEKFKTNVGLAIDKVAIARKDLFLTAKVKYDADKAVFEPARAKFLEEHIAKPEEERPKFEMEEPKLDAELADYGGGVVNLFKHCDKKYGANAAGRTFASLILNNFPAPQPNECATKEEYHRKYLMGFLRDGNKIKVAAWKQAGVGTWMKSFPRSAEKFFNYVFSQMRGHVIEECKSMIKKSN